MDIKEEKKLFRKKIKDLELSLSEDYLRQSSDSVCKQILNLSEFKSARTIFVFVSFGREIDTSLIIAEALKRGKTVAVPRCAENGRMDLCIIQDTDELAPGAYGIREPIKSCPVIKPDDIDFAIIPCLCCSKKGERMGRGGGYYDRFLANYKGIAVLPCRKKLLQERIPMEAHDAAVPFVIND